MARRQTTRPSRLRVGRSPIHGRGVFARRRLRRGDWLGRFEGRSTSRNGEHVLWWRDADDVLRGLEVTNALRFLNHSADPNAEIEGLDLIATRNIQPGAEVTIHYGDDWDDVGGD